MPATPCWCPIRVIDPHLRRGDRRRQVRSVPWCRAWTSSPNGAGHPRKHSQAKMMILGFPSNPTAQCVELDFFERVVELAKRYNVLVVHDWPMPTSSSTAGRRLPSCRCRRQGHRGGILHPVQELQHGRAGGSASWSAIPSWSPPWRASVLSQTTAPSPAAGSGHRRLEGDQQCVRDIAQQYQQRRDVLVRGLHEDGWMVENPRPPCTYWARFPEPYDHWVRWNSPRSCWREAKVCVSPGLGFG